jgi:hypothetical protein
MIRYHNDLSGKQVAQLLRRMNLLTVTSWYEGFSLPVWKAWPAASRSLRATIWAPKVFVRTESIPSWLIMGIPVVLPG